MRNALFVISGLRVGGAERMLVNLVNRLDHERFRSVVVTFGRDNPMAGAIRPDAGEVVCHPKRWRFDLGPAATIRRIIQARSIDTVVCFDLYEFVFVRRALQGLPWRPAVAISIHSTRQKNTKQELQHWLYARMLSGTELFVSVAEAQADFWSNAYRIPRSRFFTIYNGVDVNHFQPSGTPQIGQAIRMRYGIPKAAPVVLKVARLSEEKRHEVAIRALRELDNLRDPSAYLMFVGDGPAERMKKLRALAGNLGLANRVVFCGGQADVRPFHEAADVFTLTSSRESFSVAALEAMAMEVPAVLTDLSGAREMVQEGVNGYLVPPGNPSAIAEGWLRAIDGPLSHNRAAIRHSVVRRFTLNECVTSYERILEGGWSSGLVPGAAF